MAHDGGPRLATTSPEIVWVRITTATEWPDVFGATVLNQPVQLRTVAQGGSVFVRAGCGAPHPFVVSLQQMAELKHWKVIACDRCGSTALFDKPSELIAKVFPDLPAGAQLQHMSAFCPLCGGVMGVTHASMEADEPLTDRRPWWKFW